MKIFVTGGTGFVGSHFVKRVLQNGHDVIVQRRPNSMPRIRLANQPKWVDRELDKDFSDYLKGCEVVVHFASHTPNPPYAPLDECIYWNVYATSRLLQRAAELGVEKFLIAGTCFEYGTAAINQNFIHPKTEMRPETSYPISKAAATTACIGLARQYNLKMEILRIFQVFGEGEASSRFWPSLREAALNGDDFAMSSGTQIRDFVNVSDVAEQFTNALEFKGVKNGQPRMRNIGTGNGQTLIEFAQYWWKYWGAKGQLIPGKKVLRPGEVQRLVADINSVHLC